MKILLQNHSSYPWSEGGPAQRTPSESLRQQIIEEQEQVGIDIITDGQVDWPDPVSGVIGALDGVRLGPNKRYFDTKFWYPQPVITANITRRGPILKDGFLRACALARRPVKPVLLGPYTLARLCSIEAGPYRDFQAVAFVLSEILAAEVGELMAAGARIVQIDEPAILSHPEDIRLLRQVLEPLWAARRDGQLQVATYFGDAEPLYAQLNSLPGDILALDFPSSRRLADAIASTGASKELALGLIDGRSSHVEDSAAVARSLRKTLTRYALDTVHLLPSCGLGGLPCASARAKLELLARVRALACSA